MDFRTGKDSPSRPRRGSVAQARARAAKARPDLPGHPGVIRAPRAPWPALRAAWPGLETGGCQGRLAALALGRPRLLAGGLAATLGSKSSKKCSTGTSSTRDSS